MTYDQWMKDTAAFARPRSSELKALDAALKTYELVVERSSGSVLAEKQSLQRALEQWKAAQKAKGQDWRSSVRNKLKAVEKLDADLGRVIAGAGGLNSRGEIMDSEDARARRIVADAIRQNTRAMFLGQTLSVKNSKALAGLNDVRSAMSSFKSACGNIKSAAGGVTSPGLAQQVQSMLVSLFGEATASQVQEALGPLFAEFLTSVTPFVGAIKSGAKAIQSWGQAAQSLYRKSKIEKGIGSFAPGDPAAAFDAIVRIQQREINSYATSASIYTVSATAKAAFTAADFGAVSGAVLGAAETLALLVQKIYLFARDWNEMREANELLHAGVCDLRLFNSCPLLGCYLIANSDTSAVINMAVGDYGRAGWKFEVEAMVLKAAPAFEKARSVIRESRYEIASMSGMKGAAVDRTAKTLGLPTGKLSGLIADVTARIDRIGA
ncbi:MAG TPA: hypothetical protein VHE11_08210 [Steroidobacteraceae bacterium]|nr:hypothetical protein [Steroidobacteraceae bacterium]